MAHPFNIWIPTAHEEPRYVCNVPVDMDGEACGARFYRGQERAYRTHVARCAGQHENEIRSLHIFQRGAEFFDNDRELIRYAKDNATEILEGRKKL